MPKADTEHTTARDTGRTRPDTADGTHTTADDAEIIDLCERLVANRAEWRPLLETRHTLEDERRTEPDFWRLVAARKALIEQIGTTPDLATLAGASAMARAALADSPLNNAEDHWEAREDNEWLALMVGRVRGGGCRSMSRRPFKWPPPCFPADGKPTPPIRIVEPPPSPKPPWMPPR
jgi:hypothetical protein